MRPSTGWADRLRRAGYAAFWLLLWQIASMIVGQKLLLASPVEALLRLSALIRTAAFWQSILFSLGHILLGFLLAVAAGVLLAGASFKFRFVEELFAPLLAAIRAIPVASYVIVALIWLPSSCLSVLISFLVTLPILYAGTLTGLRQTDPKLLEMAQVFHMPPANRLLHIVLPAALPHFHSAAGVAMGLAWKSGVAAEVIGIPGGSIGEKLYKAKIYLATPDLFAWTLTIVLLSALSTRLFTQLSRTIIRKLERM